MLSSKEILDAVTELLEERFPGEPVYRNITPISFTRPSSLVTYVSQRMTDASCAALEVEANVMVTVFVAVDEYYNSHMDELVRRMSAVQELFAIEGLRVGDRVLHVAGNAGVANFDFAEVAITLRYLDDRPRPGQDWPLIDEVGINTAIKEKE